MIAEARKHKEVCFDTETTGINPLNSEIVALSLSWERDQDIWYYFLNHKILQRKLLDIARPFFEDTQFLK